MSVNKTIKAIQDIMRKDVGVDGDAQRLSQMVWMFFLKIMDAQDEELAMQPGYFSPLPERYRWGTWAADPEGLSGDDLMAFVNNDLFPALKELPAIGRHPRAQIVRAVFEDAYNYMKSGQLLRQVINKINEIDFHDLKDRQHFGDLYEQLLNDLQSAGNAGEYYTPRAVTAFMVDRIDPKPGETLIDPACGTGGFLTCAIAHMRKRYVKTPEDEQRMQDSLRAVEKKPLPHMLCMTNMLLHRIKTPTFVKHDNPLAKALRDYGPNSQVDIVLTNPPFGGIEEDGIETNFPKQFQTRETADLFLVLIMKILKPGGRCAMVLPDGSLFGEGIKTRIKEKLLTEDNLHTIVRLPDSVFKPYASIGTNLLFFEKGKPTTEIWYYEHRVPEGQKAYSKTKPIRLEHLQPCIDWWDNRTETEVAWKVDFASKQADARQRAQPHWDKADSLDQEGRTLELQAADRAAQAQALKEKATRLRRLKQTGAEKAGAADLDSQADQCAAESRRLKEQATTLRQQADQERKIGNGIYGAIFNLDIKNPHTVEADHGDPDELLAELDAAEAHAANLRNQLKAILGEALLR